jgi:hypothetical protein
MWPVRNGKWEDNAGLLGKLPHNARCDIFILVRLEEPARQSPSAGKRIRVFISPNKRNL